jgi:multidrug efflux pump subunit AcrA (membrane-fusion protein)
MKNMVYIILSAFLISCNSKGIDNVSTFTVVRSDFVNSMNIDGSVEPVNMTTASCPPHIEGTVEFLVEDGTYIKEGDLICIIEVKDLQTQYDQLLIDFENAKASLNTTRANLDMESVLLEAQIKNNEAETEIARLDSLQLSYLSPNEARIKQLELERVTIGKNRYEKKLKSLAIIQQSEIKKKELQIQQFERGVKDVKDRLDALRVKAPKDGLAIRAISRMTGKKLQIGDQVWSGMAVVNLPDISEMKIKIQAPEADFKYISIGDSVIYTFDAMPENSAFGKISIKSPVGQQVDRNSKLKLFDIEASIDSVTEMPEPGFSANCRIIMKQIKDTLIVPLIAVYEEDSMKVVYVKQKNGFEMRQVTTGISSLKETIIASGLNTDEIITLSRPKSSFVRNKVFLPKDTTDTIKQNAIKQETDI